MKRETLLTVAVVALLLLNAGTLGFLWLGKMPHHPPPHPRPPIDQIIIEGLELDRSQQEKFEELKHEHITAMRALDKEYDKAVEEYFYLLRSDTTGVTARLASESRIGQIQTQRAQVTLEHFRKVKEMCTPEQQTKFDSIIPKLVQIMIPPRHHPKFHPPH
ncbi:MAG: periplasmic heavy metal sensor [Chitinophagales bacterium]|nr:periplasmic heavy metal sensor [Chitinophagales bacterium]